MVPQRPEPLKAFDGTATQEIAYLNDITTANNTLLTTNNSWSGTNDFQAITATTIGAASLTATGNVSAASFTGNLTGNVLGNVTGNLFGNASTASAFAATPNPCTVTNTWATGIDASGNAICSAIASTQLTDTSFLVYNNAANIFAADKKQTFTAGPTNAGLNLAGVTVDPGPVLAATCGSAAT